MTRLTSATVEGFKGIDRIEVDPGSLTVVTGRNNTGKTSLLEALDLAYDPSAIARFGENISTLTNRDFDSASITLRTSAGRREVELASPEIQRIPDYLVQAFREEIRLSVETAYDGLSDEEAEELVNEELPEVIAEISDENNLQEVAKDILIVIVDGNRFPYIQIGPASSELYRLADEDLRERIKEREEISEREAHGPGQQSLQQFVVGTPPSGGRFLGEIPASVGATNFVDFNQLTNTLDFDEDDADPVKVDDIGDFVREHEILDDLKTFDVDHLVFEPEDGEKYSVPFEFMGEGFKTIVGVLWELLDDEDDWDLVLLEEPETHMHPGYVRQLVYFLVQLTREEGLQLFVTTHNNDFLNDFFEANFTDEEQSFLEDEFQLLQLQDGTAKAMDYADAEADLKELELDLRGL